MRLTEVHSVLVALRQSLSSRAQVLIVITVIIIVMLGLTVATAVGPPPNAASLC